jgi:predicted alpha/beta superfamily hydrolase
MNTWRLALATVAGLCLLGAAAAAVAQVPPLPKVASGTVERLESFPSRFVDARNVDVWLPEGYGRGRRYNVLYMHDGQMLFDPATTWNKQAWEVDVTMARLIREGRIPDTIVVGIWNIGKLRYAEYYPEKFLALVDQPIRKDYVERAQLGRSLADNYLRFLVEELKPAIDRKYRTHKGPEHTFVMGSSMGGLISIYAMCEYPQVFGGAAGVSTHWIGRPTAWGPIPTLQNAALPLAAFVYLREHLAGPEAHRLYMDHGTLGVDGIYGVHQAFVDEIVRQRGYDESNWMSRTFEGKAHNEVDWAERFEIPVLFLMGKK